MKWNVSNLITAYQVSLVDDHGIVTTLGGIKSPFASSYEMYFKSREQAQKVADALNMNAEKEW